MYKKADHMSVSERFFVDKVKLFRRMWTIIYLADDSIQEGHFHIWECLCLSGFKDEYSAFFVSPTIIITGLSHCPLIPATCVVIRRRQVKQYKYTLNTEVRFITIAAAEKQWVSHILSVYVCSPSYSWCYARASYYIVICGPSTCNAFFHIVS